MKRYSNFILVVLFFLASLSASAAAERWVCPDSTTHMEADGMIRIPILFGGQPALDVIGFDLGYFDLSLRYEYVERSQLTQDWVVLNGGIGIPCSVTIGGWHTEAIPAAVADTLCYVWFTVLRETEWGISTFNFVDDLAGTEGCGLTVVGNEQSSWGLIKSLLRE